MAVRKLPLFFGKALHNAVTNNLYFHDVVGNFTLMRTGIHYHTAADGTGNTCKHFYAGEFILHAEVHKFCQT